MSSICTSRCLADTVLPTSTTTRVRATYVNLHRWPESDAEFIRSLSFRSTSSTGSTSGRGYNYNNHNQTCYPAAPKVVDTISCRQMYLRNAYTFTRRKESTAERTKKWVKEKVRSSSSCGGRTAERRRDEHDRINSCGKNGGNNNKKWKEKVKEVPCAALKLVFRRLLFCGASVDVADWG